MAEVLSVLDEPTGKTVALKRLMRPKHDRLAAAMFEREYRTLSALRHPRIIEVFEYGRTSAGPFYTMELLGGGDLRELAPLPYREACRYLRDVASSLALVHARRLVHRDLSPRNVRVTPDGHAKLIDFGALCSFGVASEVVGTPPFVAPEAIRGLPLDQRTDLYGLGALAYYMLTGRHAYRARELPELEAAFRTPPEPPSAVLAQRVGKGQGSTFIPEALDALVLSLLSLDPVTRPSSAPEVIDQLALIAELDAEPLPDVGRGYLAGGRLVGRAREAEGIRAVVESAVSGHGSGVLVLGGTGVGKTRLLHELSLSAQLAGMTVASVDARHVRRGAYGVVSELIARLLIALPEATLAAARPHGEMLSRFSSVLRERLGVSPVANPMAGSPGEWRKRTQVALGEFFLALAKEQKLVLVVDELASADDASASLLTRLSRDGVPAGLIVAASLRPEEVEGPVFLRAFGASAELLRPSPLSPEHSHELVSSLFGDTPNVKRLAHLLHDRSGGLPAAIVELSEALVQGQVVRELQGLWVIPDQIEHIDAALADDANAAAEVRLRSLDAPTRALAELCCLRRAPLPLPAWLALAAEDGQPDPFGALDRLTSSGTLVLGDGAVRFAHESLRAHVEKRLPAERKQRLHRALGRGLLEQGESDVNARIEAGFHLLRGGDETRGADLLAAAGLELVYDIDEIPAAAPALEAALEIYRKERRPLHQMCTLLGPLAVAGYHTDLRLAEQYGEEALVLQERLIGLALARRCRSWLGPRLSLYVGLCVGLAGFVARSGLSGARAFANAVSLFVISSTALCGAATVCLDGKKAWRYAGAIEPLSVLGRNHVGGVAYRFAQGLAWVTEERPAASTAVMRELVELLVRDRVKGITPAGRRLLLGGARYALGAIEGFRDGVEALKQAEALDGLGSRLYDMVADQIRANFYANRGEAALAETHRRRVELHAIDTGSGWQAEVWAPCSMLNACVLTHDVLAMKRSAGQLNHLAQRIASLRSYSDGARHGYRIMRGDYAAAEDFEAFLLPLPPRSLIGWASMTSVLVLAYNMRGEHAKAREISTWALSHLGPEDLQYTALFLRLEVQHAMARAGLGDLPGAALELDALLERCEPGQGPVSLGVLHEHRGRLYAMSRDMDKAREHIERMTRYYRSTGHPALMARCVRVQRELAVPQAAPSSRPSRVQSETRLSRASFHDCLDAHARAQKVLEVLLERTHAQGGWLFALDEETPRLLAPLYGEEPDPSVLEWARAELHAQTLSEGLSVQGTQSKTETTSRRALCVLERHGEPIACAVLEHKAKTYVPPNDPLRTLLADALGSAHDGFFADAAAVGVTARRG